MSPGRGAAAVLLPVLLVAACGGDGGPDGYGAEHRADFVADCTSDDASSEACGCFYDRLAETLPFEQFVEVDESRKDGDGAANLPADLAAMAAGCSARATAEAHQAEAEADAGAGAGAGADDAG